jgi:hypothetical protein
LDENKNEIQRVNDELTDSEAVDFSKIKDISGEERKLQKAKEV